MIMINQDTFNPNYYFKYNDLEYKKGDYEINYINKYNVNNTLDVPSVKIGIRNIHSGEVLVHPVYYTDYINVSGIPFTDHVSCVSYLSENINFKEDIKLGLSQKVNLFADLISGNEAGDLSFVEQAQGTSWLPNTLGGTYYPSGWYVWNGSEWIADKNAVAVQLETSVLNISSIENRVNNLENENHLRFSVLPELP